MEEISILPQIGVAWKGLQAAGHVDKGVYFACVSSNEFWFFEYKCVNWIAKNGYITSFMAVQQLRVFNDHQLSSDSLS